MTNIMRRPAVGLTSAFAGQMLLVMVVMLLIQLHKLLHRCFDLPCRRCRCRLVRSAADVAQHFCPHSLCSEGSSPCAAAPCIAGMHCGLSSTAKIQMCPLIFASCREPSGAAQLSLPLPT